MSFCELREEIDIELELIAAVLDELKTLRSDVFGREPTVREITAAAAFLAQFYGGIENILKRIAHFHSHPLPAGDNWHSELFRHFCSPSTPPLPELFDSTLERTMAPYRKFRHLAFHSYGVQLRWDRIEEGVERVEEVFGRFREKLDDYLATHPGTNIC